MMPTGPGTDIRSEQERATSLPLSPSGRQFEIGFGTQRATIVEVGAGIRALRNGQRDVLHPYAVDEMSDGAHGAPLIPWPNRLRDGRYHFDGADYQLALTEPEKHNAIHGLLRWRPWRPVSHEADRVIMVTTLHPMQGYPFTLDVEIDYHLGLAGLTVRTTAANIGDRPRPTAAANIRYLSPGSGEIDACTLTFDAASRILTDAERQLPTGVEPIEGTAYDFRGGRTVGDLRIDYAFADLGRDEDGRAWVGLRGADGDTAWLWVDETYPIVEIYTADTLAADRRRRGLGVEPMTCPPDAFASGEGVLRLEPGQSVTTTWGAFLAAAGSS